MFENVPGAPQSAPPDNLPSAPLDDMFSGVDGENQLPGDVARPPDALQAGLLKKKTAINSLPPDLAAVEKEESAPPAMPAASPERPPIIGIILKWLIIVIIIVAVLSGVIWVYAKVRGQKKLVTSLAAPVVVSPAVVQPSTPVPAQSAPAPAAPVPLPVAPSAPSSSENAKTSLNDKILFGEQPDSDKDGLSDADEINIYHTDPHKADTDGDGLTDGDEVKKYHTDPLKIDSDNDGLTDGAEVLVWHTDPLNPDTDGDGYTDGREVNYGYNPLGAGKLPVGVPTSTGVIFRPASTKKVNS